MLSGTPVISTRLNAYGDEYKGKMFFLEKDKSEDIVEVVKKILDMSNDELEQQAIFARGFIIASKSWKVQCERINDFL